MSHTLIQFEQYAVEALNKVSGTVEVLEVGIIKRGAEYKYILAARINGVYYSAIDDSEGKVVQGCIEVFNNYHKANGTKV